MPANLPFTPGPTGTFTAGASSTNRLAFAGGGTSLLVTNAGTIAAFIKPGSASVEATTTDWLVAPGASRFFTVAGSDTHVAATTGQVTTATVYVQRGDGGV